MVTEMTSRERTAAYNGGRRVDRIPYTISLNESAVSFYGYSNTDYLFSSDVMVDVEHRIIEEFGGDNMGFPINTRAFAEIAGSKMEYRERGYSIIREYVIPDRKHIGKPLPVNVKESGRLSLILDAIKKAQDRYSEELPIWFSIPCPANCALGVTNLETFLLLMIGNTPVFDRLMTYCLEAILCITEYFHAETGLTPSLCDVTAAKPVMGAKNYNRYVFPYVEKTVEGIRRITNKTPAFTSCGSIAHLWGKLLDMNIPSLGIDCTDSIADAKREVGTHIPISGNVDGVRFLYETEEAIDKMVKDVLLDASDSLNGFTLAIGGGPVAYGASRRIISVYRDAILKYGAGAVKGRLCEGLQ